MNLSFKNRIALYYLLATATLTTVMFIVIFQVVKSAVYTHLDSDLNYEAFKHTTEIKIENQEIVFRNKTEWEEKEHREVEVNPVFIQVVDIAGNVTDKSPNLKEDSLNFNRELPLAEPFDTFLKDRIIRQVQIPIHFDDTTYGYMLAAMSLENSVAVLARLRSTLLIIFPIVLLVLYLVTRLVAGRSIRPITRITRTADAITRNNLNDRIALPRNKDEVYSLTSSINRLLDRLEQAIEREKQFTSDASHELRTPLTVLKGTLEVLIRKPRQKEEYVEKIGAVIREIDRMSLSVEQLLTLARVENMRKLKDQKVISLPMVIDEIIHRRQQALQQKSIIVDVQAEADAVVLTDPHLLDLLLDNLISNAVKYSGAGSRISIRFTKGKDGIRGAIQDEGIGIRKEDLDKIYTPFYRSEAMVNKEIKGNGLGLAIVKKISELLQIGLEIESRPAQGTTVLLTFAPAASHILSKT